MAPSDSNHLEHTMPGEILHPIVWGTSVNSLALILKTINLQVNFLEKLPKLVALQIFQSSYLSCGESLNHNTVSHYQTHTEHIFENITYITKKTPKFRLPNLVLYQTGDRGTNLDYVHGSGSHQALLVLSHVSNSCLHSSILQFMCCSLNKISNIMLHSNYNKTFTKFMRHADDCPNLFLLGLKYPSFSIKNHNDLIGTETNLLYRDLL